MKEKKLTKGALLSMNRALEKRLEDCEHGFHVQFEDLASHLDRRFNALEGLMRARIQTDIKRKR